MEKVIATNKKRSISKRLQIFFGILIALSIIVLVYALLNQPLGTIFVNETLTAQRAAFTAVTSFILFVVFLCLED